MKLSSLFRMLATLTIPTILTILTILTIPTFAQDAVRPNPQVEAKAAQALLDAEIKLQKMIFLDPHWKPSSGNYGQYFNKIAIAFARLGRTESALKATQFMTPKSASKATSEVLRLSVRRSAVLGDVKRAASLIPQIKDNNAKADALLTVARAYLRRHDYDAAQKVLFQVTPLVPKNFDALLYTATLFAESGNIDVAKRLFDRAKGMMVPVPDASEWRKDDRDVISRSGSAFIQIRTFNKHVLDAGLVDEWQPIPERPWNFQYGLDEDSLQGLLQLNEIDLAIKAAKESSPVDIVIRLWMIAYYISPKHPDRAYSILNQASDAMPVALAKMEKLFGKKEMAEFRQGLDMCLAYGYKKLGKEEEYQKWQQQLTQDTPPSKQALTQLKLAVLPLRFRFLNSKSTFPPDQLLEINETIQPYLRELHDKEQSFLLLLPLIYRQIAAEQTSQARVNIEFLDNVARNKIASAKDFSDFSMAIQVAELWKKAGDEKSCHSILEEILSMPQKFPADSKIERVKDLIMRGFVDEGLQFFYTLPVDGKKPPQSLIRGLSYSLAKAHPNQFPAEMLKAKQPYTEASQVSNFVSGLTYDLFHTPSEQAFEIKSNRNGYR